MARVCDYTSKQIIYVFTDRIPYAQQKDTNFKWCGPKGWTTIVLINVPAMVSCMTRVHARGVTYSISIRTAATVGERMSTPRKYGPNVYHLRADSIG